MKTARGGGRGSIAAVSAAASLIAFMSYLALATLHGDHGLLRLLTIKAEEVRLRAELSEVNEERQKMSSKMESLAAVQEAEILEEQARTLLSLSRSDEFISR